MSRSKTVPAVLFTAAAIIVAGSVEADDWFSRTFGGKSVKGSGDMVTEHRDVKEFTWIETLGAFDVSVKPGDRQEVLLTFDDNLLQFIKTTVRGKKLIIRSEEPYRSEHNCKVDITVPALTGVVTKGSGDMTVTGFKCDDFECETEGSGDITVTDLVSDMLTCHIDGSGDMTADNLRTDFLECRINGSGDFEADGEAEEVVIKVFGSGDVDTHKLTAGQADVVINGSGDVKVWARESFDGSVLGSGDIACYGNPEHTTRHIAGSGSIRER